MINRTDGHLIISPDVELKPNDRFEAVDKLKLGEIQEMRDFHNGYSWLTLKNVKVKDQYFILDICFKDKLLILIDLIVDNKKFDLNKSWDSWTEKAEKGNLPKFKKWIKEELGREGKFKWGQVSAGFDEKGAESSILIRYN